MKSKRSRRQVKIARFVHPVQVEIDNDGLSFWIKGNRKKITLSWFNAIAHSQTPADVQSFLYEKPFELLTHQDANAFMKDKKKELE